LTSLPRAVLLCAALLGAALVVLLPAAPASAHGGAQSPTGTDYRTIVTAVTPAVAGLTVRPIEAGSRLELTNHTGRAIEVLGYQGESMVRVRPGSVARWHDHRSHWMADKPPPQVAADPGRAQRIRDWVVPLRVDGSTVEVRGTLDWLPPPSPGTWWALCLVAAVAVAAAGMTLRRSGAGWIALAGVALIGGAAGVAYAAARALDAGSAGVGGTIRGLLTGQLWLALTSLAAIAAAAYAVRRRPSTDFVLALAGACLLIAGGLPNAPVFARSVAPAAWDGTWARLAVAAVIAAGAGLTAAGVVRIRATTAAAAGARSAVPEPPRSRVRA
jgi:hypothetical protein